MKLFTIKNKNGIEATVASYGGRVVQLHVPDRNGNSQDIVLGYDTLDGYLHSNEKYFGALIGRYGNRIGGAKFNLGGKTWIVGKNEGENSLHGGEKGFHNVFWEVFQPDSMTLELKYFSEDMEEGFPGNLEVKVVYQISDENELRIEYFASTDQPTVVNLTHHSFFNLTGDFHEEINNHVLMIPAEYYTPVDKKLIPTGELAPVEGTPFDFRMPVRIGERIEADHEQLKFGGGYDHNWVLTTEPAGSETRLAARVWEPVSGRVMEVYTNEPGIQFYGGNFLSGKDSGKGNIPYRRRTAFCLETQHFPDSPNKENFPSTLLNPRDEYHSVCIYRFGKK